MNKLEKFKLAWHSSYKINWLRERVLSILKPSKRTQIIFIFGCQRSGTTIVQKLISLNTNVKFYGEGDPPYFYDSNTDKHHRIKPREEVELFLRTESFPFIIIKPLYESQVADELVSIYPHSKAIWVFRNHLDVIDSHIHYYKQSARDYIRPLLIESDNNWINEFISKDNKQFISQFLLDELSDADIYGLFWIIRNSLFLNITKNNNILLVNYESLVKEPDKYTTKIYNFIGLPYKTFYSKLVRPGSVSKKISFELNEKIEQKCTSVYEKLLHQSKY